MTYNLKECLPVWSQRRKSDPGQTAPRNITRLAFFLSTAILPALLMLNGACSHKFAKLEASRDIQIIEQVLKVKIYKDGDLNKLTVYTQVDRKNKRAILDGTGKFDKYIFHMEVNGDRYYFVDHINNQTKDGTLNEFDFAPLSSDDIFSRIDISRPQPIVFDNDGKSSNGDPGSIRMEITVQEQR